MKFLSRHSECFRITNIYCNSHPALLSNQEEVETKVTLHNMDVTKKNELGVVTTYKCSDLGQMHIVKSEPSYHDTFLLKKDP